MENYRQKIRKRILYFRVLMVVLLLVLISAGVWGYGQAGGHVSDFSYGVQIGLAFGMLAGLIVRSRKYYRSLKDETLLKKMYIFETDERYKTINLQTSNLVFFITLYALITAAIIAGFLNILVLQTLIAVAMFMITLRGILGIYLRNKY